MAYTHRTIREYLDQVKINLPARESDISIDQESLFQSNKWCQFEIHFLLALLSTKGYGATLTQLYRLAKATRAELRGKIKNAPKKIDPFLPQNLKLVEKIKIED